MMKIFFRKVRSVKTPENITSNILKLFVPTDYETKVLLPFSDTLVPTGLIFPELFRDYVFISQLPTCPSRQALSDIGIEREPGKGLTTVPHVSPIEFGDELYIHVINLGEDDFKIKGGSSLSYFMVSPIEKIELCDEDDEDNL